MPYKENCMQKGEKKTTKETVKTSNSIGKNGDKQLSTVQGELRIAANCWEGLLGRMFTKD